MKGLGNDIVEIDRIRKGYNDHKQRFLDRLFTKKEQEHCQRNKNPFPHFAGRFAAKEAIVKALGCGFGEIAAWLDIEILADENGKPIVTLSDKLKEQFNNPQILLTISHNKQMASSVAIWI